MSRDRAPLVAHVIHRLTTGGLENGLVNLINAMPKQRYRHVIICMTDYNEFAKRIQRDDVEIFALHKREGKDLGVYWRLGKLLRKLKPDIVHSRNLSALEASVVAALAGVPYRVHGEHGRDVHDMDGTNKKYNRLRRFCQHFVQHYITVSKDLQRWLVDTVGIPARKITQIYNGVYSEKFFPAITRQALPVEGFSTPENIIFGAVGRLETVKDQTTLAKAFVELHQQRPDLTGRLKLVIVGNGGLRQPIDNILQQAGLHNHAWLAGNRGDVPDLMRGMDVFVLPSLAEGISNTVLEAMACGLPVIATNVGGNPELVADGQSGFLVPSASPEAMAHAMAKYVDSTGLTAMHGAAGRKRVEETYSMQAMVAAYLGVYDNLLHAKTPV